MADAVKVAAEAHVLRRAQLAHVVDVAGDVLHAGPAVLAQEARIEVHADPAAAAGHRADLLVGQVAEVRAELRRAGVGGHRRLAVLVDQIPEARLIQVAGVRRHLKAGHLPEDCPALRLDTLFGAALGREADLVFVVPGQRRHADAARMELAHALHAALEDFAALHGQENLHLARLGLQRRIDLLPALGFLKLLKGGVLRHRLVIRVIAHALAAGKERAGLQAHAAALHVLHRHAGRLLRLERPHVQRVAVCIADDHCRFPPDWQRAPAVCREPSCMITSFRRAG